MTRHKHPDLFPRAPEEEPESPPLATEDAEPSEEEDDTVHAPDSGEPEPTREEWLDLFEAAAHFLLVDGTSGLVLKFHILSPDEFPTEILNTVATSLLELGVMPEQIRLSSQLLYGVLAPEFEGYKTSIGLYESLPQGEHVFKEMFSRFAPGW